MGYVLTPFDFGAAGDGVTDDTGALKAWAGAIGANSNSADEPVLVRAERTGAFRFSEPLVFAPAGAHGRVHMDLRGWVFRYTGGDDVTIMQFGDEEHEWNWSTIDGLHLRRSGAQPVNTTALHLAAFDHGTIRDSVISVGGEQGRGILAAPVGAGSVHGLELSNVHVAGPDTLVSLTGANGCTIRRGKLQQGATGLRCVSLSNLIVENVDFSLLRDDPVLLEYCGNVRLDNYFEKCGPGTQGNTAALYRLLSCTSVRVSGSLSCAHSVPGLKGTHVAYGAYLSNCHAVRFDSTKSKLARLAVVHAEPDCTGVVVSRGNVKEDFAAYDNGRLAPLEGVQQDGQPEVGSGQYLAAVDSWATAGDAVVNLDGTLDLPSSTALAETTARAGDNVTLALTVSLVSKLRGETERVTDAAALRVHFWRDAGSYVRSDFVIGPEPATYRVGPLTQTGGRIKVSLGIHSKEPVRVNVHAAWLEGA